MKKIIFLTVISILSVTVLFSIDEAPSFTNESIDIQNQKEKNLVKMQPTGIWFSEEEIIDE